jgi:hypothetical protein
MLRLELLLKKRFRDFAVRPDPDAGPMYAPLPIDTEPVIESVVAACTFTLPPFIVSWEKAYVPPLRLSVAPELIITEP